MPLTARDAGSKGAGENQAAREATLREAVVVDGAIRRGPLASPTPDIRAGRYEGGKELYVSRSKIGKSRGSIIDEDKLETRLQAHGYDILHPQHHDLATQVARYKAADTILACEGSALHVVGMVAVDAAPQVAELLQSLKPQS